MKVKKAVSGGGPVSPRKMRKPAKRMASARRFTESAASIGTEGAAATGTGGAAAAFGALTHSLCP